MNQDQTIYSPDESTVDATSSPNAGFRPMGQVSAAQADSGVYMPDEETVGREPTPTRRPAPRNDSGVYMPDEETVGREPAPTRRPAPRNDSGVYMPDEETVGREPTPTRRPAPRNDSGVYMPDEETVGREPTPVRNGTAGRRNSGSGYNPDEATEDGAAGSGTGWPASAERQIQKDSDTRTYSGKKRETVKPARQEKADAGMNLPFRSALSSSGKNPEVPVKPAGKPASPMPFRAMNPQEEIPAEKPRAARPAGRPAAARPATTPEPVVDFARNQNDDAPISKGNPPQGDGRRVSLKEMETQAQNRYNAEMSSYEQQMSRWKSRLWIPPVVLVLVVAAALVAGAFMGVLGVIVVVLAAAGTVAILLPLGKLNWMKKPKKPQKQQLEMKTPEFGSIYSVRLRLQSVNLAKPVEVTIRKEEQLIGSDSSVCLQALDYKGISRRHFTIISRREHGHTEYFIRDENSKNGTKLNDKKLMPGAVYPLRIGDQITLAGRYSFRVMSDAF